MLVQINVTQEDIEQGIIRDCVRCPAALAITRKLDPMYYAWVSYENVNIILASEIPGFGSTQASVPINWYREASNLIKRFDRRRKVEPIVFSMYLPNHLLLRTLVEGNLP